MSELPKSDTYYHIDNGGISINLALDRDRNVQLDINAAYFGYPAVASSINLGYTVGTAELRELATNLHKFADEIDQYNYENPLEE